MNKKQFICIAIIILTLFSALYILLSSKSSNSSEYYAELGKLNLEDSSLDNKKIIALNGEWTYYPNALMEDITDKSVSLLKVVPHLWERDSDLDLSPYGYGTYSLEISGLTPLEFYGVDIVDEVTAYSLFVNNKEVASNGIVGKSKDNYRPCWMHKTGVFQADSNGNAKFIMEISNFDYFRGGFWNSINIGSVESIIDYTQNEKNKAVFLFTTIFIYGLINLSLFNIYQKDKSTLYFSLFCFSIALYTLLIGQRVINNYLPVNNWYVLVKLEYISGYMLLPLFGLFMLNLLENKPYQIWIKRFFYTLIVCNIVIVLIPSNLYSALMEPYKWAAFIFAFYFSYQIFRSDMNWNNGYLLFLFALSVMTLCIMREIFIGGVVSWVPYASLVFVLCFSLIIAKRFLGLIKTKELLESKIIRDSLTGLYNRNYLEEIEIKRADEDLSLKKYIMFLDLDDFKNINDTYGHKIGDYILLETGKRLSRVLRASDTICRYGGDEFVIIVTAENDDEIRSVADRIIQEIKFPYERDGSIYNIGVSIGISSNLNCLGNIDSYIKNSDDAMYEAKKNGKNQYVFYDG